MRWQHLFSSAKLNVCFGHIVAELDKHPIHPVLRILAWGWSGWANLTVPEGKNVPTRAALPRILASSVACLKVGTFHGNENPLLHCNF